MTVNISSFGSKIIITASKTFPVPGVTLTQFGHDVDPADVPSMQIADTKMNVNGNLVTWSVANAVKVSVSLIAGSQDDIAMSILFEANRVGKGKKSVNDIINMTILYPDGTVQQYFNGVITDGMPGRGISPEGAQKTNVYQFSFENRAFI